jgi:hypothetical protein
MGYALFLVIAFVLLGVERIVTRRPAHTVRHQAPPTG